jgi:pimeloyl-ACP methyl ester carboxylesterase
VKEADEVETVTREEPIMKRQRSISALLAVAACLWTAGPGLAAEAPRRPELSPCKESGTPAGALCGTYEVFENRAARTGRKIPLRVVVLPAQGTDRLPDPLIYFAGGPGDGSVEEGLFMAQQLAALRARRDVLLVDLRGTGKSGGLFCPELQGSQGVQGFLDNFLPTDKIHACRDRLKKLVDLSWYTTDAAIDDVEEVRTALGYGKLNLMGGSYGTRAVLTYLRRHPGSARTATLLSSVRPDERYPLGLARATQTALDGLIAECAGDPACRQAFPQLRQEVDAVLRRAAAEPVKVGMTDPATGQAVELRLGQRGVAQTLRYMLYSPAGAAVLPLEVHAAAQGDWKPLALSARLYGSAMTSTADGFYQSVTCAEDVAFIRDAEIAPAVAGTFMGDFRVRLQKAACEGWPTRDLGKEIQAAVVSDVPALLISGERDPATPKENAAQVVRTLKRGRHLIIADGAHSTDGMQGNDCLFGLLAAFIEAGAAEGLDTSCIAGMKRPDFALSLGDPEVTLSRADLERLAGSYADKESGLVAKIDLLADRLRASLADGFQVLLIPTAPNRFRMEGMGPGQIVTFQMNGQVTGGRATALVVSQPGRPDLVMPRTE